jgi:hypothetical protein
MFQPHNPIPPRGGKDKETKVWDTRMSLARYWALEKGQLAMGLARMKAAKVGGIYEVSHHITRSEIV